MVVCKFFLQGNCRYGANCRNEHPRQQNTTFGNQNRFGALASGANGDGAVRKDTSWSITTNDVKNDFTPGKGRPQWILSTYGPGRNAPATLLDGNEYSPEEVRLRFYEEASKGNAEQADREAVALWQKTEQAMTEIANNAHKVIGLMEEADKRHPNRYDFCRMNGTTTLEQVAQDSQSSNTFGGGSSSPFIAGNAFGQPSSTGGAFGKPSTTFVQPFASASAGSGSFGQPSQPSTFGAPHAFGKPAFGSAGVGQTSKFGQPSQPSSTFGHLSQPTSAFGQPSQLPTTSGQPAQVSAFGSSGFDQVGARNPFAAPSAISGFPRPSSTFGQPSQPTSTFGQPSQPTSTFGKPSQPMTAFGQPAQPTSTPDQVSQPVSTFSQTSQPISTFGQASQASSTFGQPAQATSGFGQPSSQAPTFGQPSQPTSTFGQPSQSVSDFGQPSSFGQGAAFGKAAFGQASQSTPPSFGQTPQAPVSPFGQPSAGTVSDGTLPLVSGSTSAPSNPFGLTSATESSLPFGVRPAASMTSLGQPKGTSPLGQPSALSNPFMQPKPGSRTASSSSLPAPVVSFSSSSTAHPLMDKPARALHYSQTLPGALPKTNLSKQLTAYRGRRVQYINNDPCYERPDGRGWEHIWYLNGGAEPEVVALGKKDRLEELQGKMEDYTDVVKDQYRYLFENGSFRDGRMPLVPPMREWCLYDF